MDKFSIFNKYKRTENRSFAAGKVYPKGKDGPMGVIELYSPKYFTACAIGL